ncbi:MAG: Smr/MutS family protein, partial [Terriglobales bacterium]
DYIKHLISDLQKQPSMTKAQKAQADLEKLRKELGWIDQPGHNKSGAPAQEQIAVGRSVRVRSLGQTGTVEEIADDGRVSVRAGAVKIKVPLADLELVSNSGGGGGAKKKIQFEQKGARASSPASTRGSAFVDRQGANNVFIQTQGNTLDLRGQRVHDALANLDQFLDESSVCGTSPVMIIHGHGTGAVKSAVRQTLSDSSYVKKFRSGEMYEGGDGVTIIDLH